MIKSMKIIGMAACMLLFFVVQSWATPTVAVSTHDVKGKYAIIKVIYTSDGTDAAAVDLIAGADAETKRLMERGFTAMVISVDPSSGGTAPNNDVDLIITDSTGVAIYTSTGNAIAAASDTVKLDLSSDLAAYPFITTTFYFTLEDLGDSGDITNFYIRGWVETK